MKILILSADKMGAEISRNVYFLCESSRFTIYKLEAESLREKQDTSGKDTGKLQKGSRKWNFQWEAAISKLNYVFLNF